MPTNKQLESLYRVCYQLTYTMLQPIHPLRIIASPDDSDFDEKVQAAIRQKLELATNNSSLHSNHSNATDV
jgi:hypothetical protein